MIRFAPDPDDREVDLDALFPLGDGTADATAWARCPYCGADVELLLDPGGGAAQQYVEDCEVCCRPWRVSALWDEEGRAVVRLRTEDE